MIIRQFRYRLRPGTAASFQSVITTDGFPSLALRPGLLFAYAARSPEDEERGVVLTGWTSFDAIDAIVGRRLDRPTFLPGTFEFADERAVSHWEALDLAPVGSEQEPTIVRILSGRVRPGNEAAFFGHVRTEVWPALATIDGLAGAWVGRQANGSGSEPVLAVTAWRSAGAIADAGGGPAQPIFEAQVGVTLDVDGIEEYEIFNSIPERREAQADGARAG